MRVYLRGVRHHILIGDGHKYSITPKIEHESEVMVFGNLACGNCANSSRSRQALKAAVQRFAVVQESSYLS